MQYSITQYPILRAQFPSQPTALLQEALASHRRASALEPANNDVLFNTAQVLSSLVAAIDEAGVNNTNLDPSALLEEAIALFQRCLAQQELDYEQALAQAANYSAEDPGGVALSGDDNNKDDLIMTSPTAEEDQWAVIVEPVTMQTLLDTACALLDTLAQACTLLAPTSPTSLKSLESMAQSLINDKINAYMQNVDAPAQRDAWLVKAHYATALLEASYRAGVIVAQHYEQSLTNIFELATGHTTDLRQSAGYLLSYADALVALNGSLAESNAEPNMRWRSLVKALDMLLAATKAPDAEMLPSIHAFRGDVELLRLMVIAAPGLPETLSNDKVKATLLKNAETYYRGAVAVSLSSISWSQSSIVLQAKVKRAVVEAFIGTSINPLRQLIQQGTARQTVVDVVTDMADESLITEEQKQQILAV